MEEENEMIMEEENELLMEEESENFGGKSYCKDYGPRPCGPIMELFGQRKRYTVSYGIKPLLGDMAGRVIERQPKDIYDFLALFMDKTGRHRWQKHLWSYEGSSLLSRDLLARFLAYLNMSKADVTRYAIIIQKTWRGFLGRRRVQEIRMSKGVKHGHGKRASLLPHSKSWAQHVWNFEGGDVSRFNDKELEELLGVLRLSDTAASHYATIIQKAFRGHKARERVKALRKSRLGLLGETDVNKIDVSPSISEGALNEEEGYEEDSRTYEAEEESDIRSFGVEEEMDGATTGEEEEDSLAKWEAAEANPPPLTPPNTPPPSEAEQQSQDSATEE